MPAPTYDYVWVLYPHEGNVRVFSKLEMLKDNISESGALGLRQVQEGTTTWKFTTSNGKSFKAVKQKVLDSTGLNVGG